jgi:putative PEP-CTERM system TPR-repeat lipoprotein
MQDKKQGGRALMRLGRLVTSMGELNEGLEYLKQAVQQAENPYLNKLELARVLILAGKISESLELCKELQTENPKDMNGFMCEAVAYNKAGEIKKAQALYHKVLKKNSQNIVASRLLYGTYFDAEKYDQAENILKKYLLNIENDEFALLGLFYIAKKRNKPKKAIRYLEKSFKKNKTRIATAIELSRYYLNNKDIKQALSVASSALKNNVYNMALLEVKGLAELSLSEFTFAENTFNRLLKIDEENEMIIAYLARAYEGNKNFNALEVLAKRMMEKNPDTVMGRIYQIEVLVRKKRWSKAHKLIDEIDIKRLDKIEYDLSLIWALKGRIKAETGKANEAEKAFETAFALSAKTERLLQLAHYYRLNNNQKKSFEKLEEWLSNHQKDFIVKSYLADFYLNEGKYQQAIKLYMALNDTYPSNPSILNNLAWSYFKLQKMTMAADYIKQAREIDGVSLRLMDTEAEIFYALKAYDKAVRLYTKMIDINEENYFVKYKLSKALVMQNKPKEALAILETISKVVFDYKMKGEAVKLYEDLKLKEVF